MKTIACVDVVAELYRLANFGPDDDSGQMRDSKRKVVVVGSKIYVEYGTNDNRGLGCRSKAPSCQSVGSESKNIQIGLERGVCRSKQLEN